MIDEVGGTIDRMNGRARQLDQVTDSAVDAAAGRRLRGPGRSACRSPSLVRQGRRALLLGSDSGGSAPQSPRRWSESMQTGKDAAARGEQRHRRGGGYTPRAERG